MITVTEAMHFTYKVRDGEVKWGDPIWWWCEDGPMLIRTQFHWENTWRNLLEYPQYHSIEKPISIVDEDTGIHSYPDLGEC